MLLKVGELANRCGLTVRTLHHYDAIGLLTPSARSEVGYRLYSRTDIARLHQIQALRRFGMSLADIGALLAKSGGDLSSIVKQQVRVLDQQIEQATTLRDRLTRLHGQLTTGEEPELADWLTTLELMTMYDKYFSQDELKQLPFDPADDRRNARWAALVAEVRDSMAKGIVVKSEAAQALARRWMTMLERDTNSDARLFAKLDAMHNNEPSLQAQTGITPDVTEFIGQAFAETKLAIYARYLSPDEFKFMRSNYGKRSREWPELIGEARQHMKQGTDPSDPQMQRLALRWLSLFRSYAGDNPETHAKIRTALEHEPELLSGTWIDRDLLAFIRQAMSHLQPL